MSRAAVRGAPVRGGGAVARERQPQAGHHPHGPAAAILDLQRTAGNRAIAGVIQRKVGFEAELQVNIFGADRNPTFAGQFKNGPGEDGPFAGPPCPPRVIDFLTQGVRYTDAKDDDIGKNDYFDLKADHSAAGNTVVDLFHKLYLAGYAPTAHRLTHDTWPSILEYASTAVDELKPGADKDFGDRIKAVQDHAKAIFDAGPKERVVEVPSPGKNLRAGYPVTEIRDWLGDATLSRNYWRDIEHNYEKKRIWFRIQDQLDQSRAALKPEIMIQVTAGIIPSALPVLYEDEIKRSTTGPQFYELLVREINEGVQALFADGGFQKEASVMGLKDNSPESEALNCLLYTSDAADE